MVTNFVILFAFPWKPTSYIIRVSMVTNLIFVICIDQTVMCTNQARGFEQCVQPTDQ